MSESTSSRFETYLAVCIAIATVLGAVLAARATLLNDDANEADQIGIASTLDLALAQSSHEAQRAQNLTAFLDFATQRRSAELMVQEMNQLNPADPLWQQLDDESSAEWNKAINSRYFFDSNYYDKLSNTWDQQTFMDGKLVEAASLQDLNPEPHFTSADDGRVKATKFVGGIAVLSAALFCFAVANVIRYRIKYAVAALGTLILIGSAVVAILIETGAL
jgi:hypothetical protein